MPTAAELQFEEELAVLEEISRERGWKLERGERPLQFTLGMQARDNAVVWFLVDCSEYKAKPPAWHWYDPVRRQIDTASATPKGSGFIHGNGVICAPWNRLAYKNIDPRGPHTDWTMVDWVTNPQTGFCNTLSAMALRMFTELWSERYQGFDKAAA